MQSSELALILRLLRRRVGDLSAALAARISALSTTQLAVLAEDLLDFSTIAELEIWLANLPDDLPDDPLGR